MRKIFSIKDGISMSKHINNLSDISAETVTDEFIQEHIPGIKIELSKENESEYQEHIFDNDDDWDDYLDEDEFDREPAMLQELLPKDKDSSFLYEFIFEACEYYSNLGYYCDSADVFRMVEALGSLKDSEVDVKQLLKTCLVHGAKQDKFFDEMYENFKDAYFYRQNQYNLVQKKKDDFEQRTERLKNQIYEYESRKRQLIAELEARRETKEVEKAKQLEKNQGEIENLNECLKNKECLKRFVQMIRNCQKPNQQQLTKEIQDALKIAMTKDNTSELMKAIKERGKLLKGIKSNNNDIKSQIKQAENNIRIAQQQIEAEEEKFHKRLEEIVKQQSISHREVFDKALAHRSVKSSSHGEVRLDKSFKKMTEKEQKQVSEYIRDNARKFRTRLTKTIRTDNAHKLDISATIKKSCQTGGIPLQLRHKKPERQKANLILILDVSGSCKAASELMLVFMHAMKEVFPGGCKTYAFTNVLYDISPFFDTDNPDESVKNILDAIPRAGAYSNYERPFRTFYQEHMHEVTGNSYVYFIGDARNNKNDSGKDYVKAIARKAKKAFWLNTEEVELWDTGDSIISTYAKYMTKTVQTVTPEELLGFLGN